MSAGNRSPLGFPSILLFHLCILAVGVLLQNAFERSDRVFYLVLGAGIGLGIAGGMIYRGFLWDVFRSFKSAGALITLLCVSCILGTFIIQDLDLRRAGIFQEGPPPATPTSFDEKSQARQFAIAESHGWLWLNPTEERTRLTKEKVVLSDVQKAQVALREQAFGKTAAASFEKGVLASKQRHVNEMTTQNYAREHWDGLYTAFLWCRKLRLFDIFEAWWFYMLLGLIGINVIVGTFARAPWSKRDFGVAVTHAGILIILSGAALDRIVAKEGYIHYVYGDPAKEVASKIKDDKNQTYHHLPFRVKLERFATEYYHELLVRRIDWSRRADGSAWGTSNGHTGSPLSALENYPVRSGVPMKFEDGKITLTVTDYKPRVLLKSNVEDVPGGKLNPAVELAVYRQATGGRNLLYSGNSPSTLFAFDQARNGIDLEDFRFEYVWAKSAAEYDALRKEAPTPDNGVLVMRVPGQPPVRVKVELGGTRRVQIGDDMLEVQFQTIQSALAAANNVNLARRLQRTEEPVLFLKVNKREVAVPRDDSHFTSDFDILEGVEFRFDWPNPKGRGVFSIYRVLEADGKPRVLLQADYAGAAKVNPVRPGASPVALAGRLKGYYFGVSNAVRSGRVEPAVEVISDETFLAEGGGQTDHLMSAWAKVEIDGPYGKVVRELTPYDGEIKYGDDGNGKPLYAFSLFQTKTALDWFSVLTVLDHEGNKVKSHPVQVNVPLTYQGYRFFQATAATRSDGLSVSGISVTYNPGVNFMYLGFYILTLGVCYVFFLRPVIDKDRRRGGVLFNFAGRIDRRTFWTGGFRVLLGIDAVAVTASILLGSGVFWFFVLFWWVPTLWPRLALHVKRCHDVGRSGWFILVPVWAMFEVWALRSYPDDNAFGPKPGA